MNSTEMDADSIRPDMIRRVTGGWLAVAPKSAVFSIGVTAMNEQEARDKFRSVYRRWVEIRALDK